MKIISIINEEISSILGENKLEDNISFTDTLQFKNWFGNSKVVDKEGNPLPVYHGSPVGGIENFKNKDGVIEVLSSGLKEYGIFFTTNIELAKLYKENRKLSPEYINNIKKEIVKLQNIQNDTRNSKEYYEYNDMIEKLKRKLRGEIYQSYLKIVNPFIFDAKGKDGYYGWKEAKIDIGYKTAVGFDAIEAVAGYNSMYKSNYDGIIAKNIIDFHTYGSDDPKHKNFHGDAYVVFSPSQIMIEKEI